MEINGRKLPDIYREGCFLTRTDNSIKNHFYSKLRKFIRKLIRTLAKSTKGARVDYKKYNSDLVYKLVKDAKLPYDCINGDALLAIIDRNEERNYSITTRGLQGLERIPTLDLFASIEDNRDEMSCTNEGGTPLSDKRFKHVLRKSSLDDLELIKGHKEKIDYRNAKKTETIIVFMNENELKQMIASPVKTSVNSLNFTEIGWGQ